MNKEELSKLIAQLIFDDFDAIEEFYEDGDIVGLQDEIYECLENME